MKKYSVFLLPLFVLLTFFILGYQQFKSDQILSLKGEYISDAKIFFDVTIKKREIHRMADIKEKLIENEKLHLFIKQYANPAGHLNWKQWLSFYLFNFVSGETGLILFLLVCCLSIMKFKNVRLNN